MNASAIAMAVISIATVMPRARNLAMMAPTIPTRSAKKNSVFEGFFSLPTIPTARLAHVMRNAPPIAAAVASR